MKSNSSNDAGPQNTTSSTASVLGLPAALADGLKGASADFANLVTRNFWKRFYSTVSTHAL